MKPRVVLLFGGRSSEHEVSSMSAREVLQAIDRDKYEVVPIGITKEGTWMLPESSRRVLEGGTLEIPPEGFSAQGDAVTLMSDRQGPQLTLAEGGGGKQGWTFDVVFPLLHGPYGEDGTVQGLLEMAGLAYVGSGVLGSALGMDKEKMKLMLHAHGLPIPEYVVVRAHEWESDAERLLDEAAWLGFPSFAKPANLGSSVGVSRCMDLESLRSGIEKALQYDTKVLVEEGIPGRELECAVLGNEVAEASVVGEVLPGAEFYDYRAKYLSDDSSVQIPADIPGPVEEIVRRYALRAFRAIDAAGLARVDFFFEQGGRGVVVNEINTMPGFTRISMYPKLWEATGVGYSELIDRLIQLGIDRHRRKIRPETAPPPI